MITYFCCGDEDRRTLLAGQTVVNGIDFLEVVDEDAVSQSEQQRQLRLNFINQPGPKNIARANVKITGGDRITDVAVDQDPVYDGNVLVVHVNHPGDFSTYTLQLIDSTGDPYPGLDPILNAVDFSFKVECPTDFDCAPVCQCATPVVAPPNIDYLSKDYEGFRQLMLDRMSLIAPGWTERNPADLGVVLVELLAYVGDYLSYQQDAVATEAYLETARKRVSVARHAKLVDYQAFDGCNARVWVQIAVSADDVLVNAHTPLMTNINGQPVSFNADDSTLGQAAAVFETMESETLYEAHNEMFFHTWGDSQCCLPKGATRATLRGDFPNLAAPSVLIFKERLGPITGVPADGDPNQRCAVRLTTVTRKDNAGNPLIDPLGNQPITQIQWHPDDALPFSICLSSTTDSIENPQPVTDVSSALGNIILADHGQTISETFADTPVARPPTLTPGTGGCHCTPGQTQESPTRYRPLLSFSPITRSARTLLLPDASGETQRIDTTESATAAMQYDLINVLPDIELNPGPWQVTSDLLAAEKTDRFFVVETESDGTSTLRFGDDINGMSAPVSTQPFTAQYRIGNGTAGNVGAGAIKHVGQLIPGVESVSNPMPATGGQDPQEIEDIRKKAPIAFRHQERAVTEADYATMAERDSNVQQAHGTFRWTGSWHTAFVTIDPFGVETVSDGLRKEVRAGLERYRMVGCDLEIDKPIYVSLEIAMLVCVQDNYFRADVKAAVLEILSNRRLPDGRLGLFYPDNFSFGQPVYISPIYAAVQAIDGVASVQINTFRRLEEPWNSGLAKGQLTMGRLEIARLDNDPDFQERGILRLTMGGGL